MRTLEGAAVVGGTVDGTVVTAVVEVDVDAEVSRMGDPVPPMFWFRDADGHTLLVVEQS